VIEAGQGALITGPAGTGKSTILKRLEEDLKARKHKVKKISVTNVACKRLGLDASTVHSFIHHFVLNGSFSGWLLIDECSMLSALLVTLLENLASVPGVKIVLFGDFNQLLPPMNRWRMHSVAADAFQHSRLLHLWADGAEFRLTRCWRTSQVEFFDFCQSLLTMPLDEAVQLCRSRFPPTRGRAHHLQGEMHLVLSHRRRVKINKLCQEAAVKKYRAENPEGRVALVEPAAQEEGQSSTKVAQTFELFAGTRLVGANNETACILNGVFMTVGAVREDDCDVVDEFGNSSTLTFAAIARSTRLAWAITIDSSQSREFECPVVLWDLGSRFYTLRRLYVAITRVKRPDRLVVV
jgi:ATP-dependent exoDNAse (exonuclease V) alpha subunit